MEIEPTACKSKIVQKEIMVNFKLGKKHNEKDIIQSMTQATQKTNSEFFQLEGSLSHLNLQ